MKKSEFLKDVDNFSNHRFLLWEALEATKELGLPILELGAGFGSTPFLQQYAKDNSIELLSYDYDKEWAVKVGAKHVTSWNEVDWTKDYGVVLCDESPGEHRRESIQKLFGKAVIIVVHDSEIEGWNTSDYKVRPLFKNFKYMFDLKSDYHGGAWATALSNVYDVNKFDIE